MGSVEGGGTPKMKALTPFKFYGEDAPRKISKDPKQVIEPLMEWAEKVHWKQGGLAGHRGKESEKDPLPKPAKTAKDFCFAQRIEDLGMEPTREEYLAMKPDLLEYWQGLPTEEIENFEAMHKVDVARFDQEMKEYKKKHPEYESMIRRKKLEQKKKPATKKRKPTSKPKRKRTAKKARMDVKIEYSEDEVSSGIESGQENEEENTNENDEVKTPPRTVDVYEFPLSPRSIRRHRRESRRTC